MERTGVRQYVIYDNPSDHPGCILVRGWKIVLGLREPQPDAEAIFVTDVDSARNVIKDLIGPAATMIDDNDPDPAIVEVWQ